MVIEDSNGMKVRVGAFFIASQSGTLQMMDTIQITFKSQLFSVEVLSSIL